MPKGSRGGSPSGSTASPRCARARRADGEEPEPGTILLAPGGRHLEIESVGGRPVTRVVPEAGGDRYTPSVDRLFETAAKAFGPELVGVILTGMGDDGRLGAQAIQRVGRHA